MVLCALKWDCNCWGVGIEWLARFEHVRLEIFLRFFPAGKTSYSFPSPALAIFIQFRDGNFIFRFEWMIRMSSQLSL